MGIEKNRLNLLTEESTQQPSCDLIIQVVARQVMLIRTVGNL